MGRQTDINPDKRAVRQFLQDVGLPITEPIDLLVNGKVVAILAPPDDSLPTEQKGRTVRV